MDVDDVLEQLGLSKTEAKVYRCLLEESPLPAATVADRAGASRSSVYLILRSLADKGLIEAGAGYGSRYHAAPPAPALAALLERERAELRAHERHVEQVLPELVELFDRCAGQDGEVVEILRTPKVVAERFDRLQSEALETIDVMIQGPIEVGGSNEAEAAALRRGVRVRVVYGQRVLADPEVSRYLDQWAAAGEQARCYQGDLPMKFALFDSHTVVMPMSGSSAGGVAAIIVRHPELAAALEMVFSSLWHQAEPLKQ